MMNRRKALVTLGFAAFGGERLSRSGLVGAVRGVQSPSIAFEADLPEASNESLAAGLKRLSTRTYSEEGIPMFLACENLAVNGASPERPRTTSSFNDKVASAFQRYAIEWHKMKPHAPATDVAKIVELLADRDFAKGGTETSL